MEAFQFFYEIGTEWSSTESFSFADSSDAEQFFKFSALFWSALFCCASNRLFSSFAAIKSFSSTIEVSLCIELNRFFDLFRVFLGLESISLFFEFLAGDESVDFGRYKSWRVIPGATFNLSAAEERVVLSLDPICRRRRLLKSFAECVC